MKLCTVVGARPQFIKLWPLAGELDRRSLEHHVIHTGQHFDDNMSEVFFSELGMATPTVDLQLGGLSPAEGTGRMVTELGALFAKIRPDVLIVFGDTNSTLAAAVAASKTAVPVAHVEAGLRSFDRKMPEEVNRVLTDHVSELLFCPTSVAVNHLANEGITAGVFHVGDIMYDAALLAASMKAPENLLPDVITGGPFALATVHRAQSTASADALGEIIAYLEDHATKLPVLLPLHPRTSNAMKRYGLSFSPRIHVVEPMSYLRMAYATAKADLIITDSGGLQKEAYFHRTPCITLRPNTEWTETVTHGWNRLWKGPDFLERREITEYGTGDTASRVVDHLLTYLTDR
ncbi:MAG: UDP-N-acetylglucosamine 2-epimerase (non-hydrolyzing) [Acidimicrobiales bacterium]|nr:UDP-N-acetylglucosamine 2-epimerase (non-hydrolyzing) [Acidimicrobiales bacterium]